VPEQIDLVYPVYLNGPMVTRTSNAPVAGSNPADCGPENGSIASIFIAWQN
jgi:hypothetical protein